MKRLATISAVLALAACGRTLFHSPVQYCVFDTDCPTGLHCVDQLCEPLSALDGGALHGNKRFGEPCDAGAECDSTWCVGGPAGQFCTAECGRADAGCPFAFDCKQVGAQPLCAVPQNLLCQTCEKNTDCGATGADHCLATDGGDHFCGKDCNFTGCPDQYSCVAGQCAPSGKTCDCTVDTLGLRKGCRAPNQFGACQGNQICQADAGFTACDAPMATAEVCDGLDNDCDGFVDDFTPPSCTKSANGHTCTGPQVCFASAGLVCDAPTPIDEICNYFDDDCNGVIDDPFVDSQGRYLLTTNCGGCFRDCSKLLANSVIVSCDATGPAPDAGGVCHVEQCAPGFYVVDGGTACLELPDTLCRPCANDADCVGPGSKCLMIDSQLVCGRDCSPTSAYAGGCPAGYTCGAQQQCVPTTGSCNCQSAASIGAERGCSVSTSTATCNGFQSCNGMAWSSCDVNDYNPEICDGIDNNCNGQIDEGWKNQTNGRYESPQNCGFCNNDCTKYFSPTLQHTTGVCNLVPAMPVCMMGPCLTEVDNGTTFEWVDVDKSPVNGCECERVLGNLTGDLPDRAAPWTDENCDGIDGVIGDAIFVSASGTVAGTGTMSAPFNTISRGVTALQANPAKKYVLVTNGVYRENVKLFEGAQIFGGYSGDFLKRDPLVYTTQLIGQPVTPGGARAAIDVANAGNASVQTVVAGFTIIGWDVNTLPADSTDGPASIAVLLQDCGPNVVLATNEITGGRGGDGGRGKTGAQGFGRQTSVTLNGKPGIDALRVPGGTCTAAFNHAGGGAGLNATCPVGNADVGGNAICPQYNVPMFQGTEEQFPVGGNDGRGGWDWTFDSMSGQMCDHVTESGWPTNIQSHDGLDGNPGVDGTGGTGGTGAAAPSRFGSIVGGVWSTSPAKGILGGSGGTAHGGGGGGSGGGVAKFTGGGGFGNCQAFEIGATGGGGGAGACGGTGGDAGGAAGASIAVLISYSSAASASSLPTLTANRSEGGLGGTGGAGGFGGAGGLGGAGGFGGTATEWSSSTGGKGGEGGNGGPGGGGGGGAGGPSFGILAFNVAGDSLSAGNTFVTPGTANPGGTGGTGGSSPGTSGTGTAGVRGATQDLLSLTGCASGCTSGTTCDANNVCVPN